MKAAVLPLFSVLLVVAAQVLLKAGARSFGASGVHPVRTVLGLLRSPGVFAGLVLYAVSAALWVVALSRTPLSYAYPFLGLSYVGVALTANLVLGERLTRAQWWGMGMVVLGVGAVGLSM